MLIAEYKKKKKPFLVFRRYWCMIIYQCQNETTLTEYETPIWFYVVTFYVNIILKFRYFPGKSLYFYNTGFSIKTFVTIKDNHMKRNVSRQGQNSYIVPMNFNGTIIQFRSG